MSDKKIELTKALLASQNEQLANTTELLIQEIRSSGSKTPEAVLEKAQELVALVDETKTNIYATKQELSCLEKA